MNIIGHTKNLKFLELSLESASIASAYLFLGSEHLGKFRVALDFAKKLIGRGDQDINPDLIILSPEKEEKKGIIKEKDIKIEKIRELEKELSLSAYFGKRKVAIIEKADRLTISAQNALLKTLEEPAAGCVLILITSQPERILPTIQSRCLRRNFSEVEKTEIEKIIPGGYEKKDLVFWSMGRPGLAFSFLENKEALQKRIRQGHLLSEILSSDLTRRFKEAENLAKDADELRETLEAWSVILRENILRGGRVALSKEASLKLMEEIEKVKKIARQTNSNIKTLLENLFLKI